jgi:uncharacterized protein (TIGR02757 family)
LQQHLLNIKKLLDIEVGKKNCLDGLLSEADPLRVAKMYEDEVIALICALFAYGNARLIERFLRSLDFNLLNDERVIEKELDNRYYRFQSINDVKEIFITFSRIKKEGGLKAFFLEGYRKNQDVMDGLSCLIEKIYSLNRYSSTGYEFFFGKIPDKKHTSPYKRYHMFLRWMVRQDELDIGLWQEVSKSHLLMPLDVHTFNVSKKLGLLKRKTYDFKAVLELTETLCSFDKNDPIKYDFALYRLGQSKEIDKLIL